MEILKGENLTKFYGKRKVLDDFNVNVKGGEIVGLLGPNGAGKTTTLLIISGFVKAEGKITLNGADITRKRAHERAKMGIVYLPQSPSVFPDLTVLDNLMIACEVKGKDGAQSLIEKFGLEKVIRTKAGNLSGGERRKVEIARTFILEPKFVLLDEPFAGIEPKTVQAIAKMVEELARVGVGVVVSDHNVRDTLKICSKIFLIHEGRKLVTGTPEEVLSSQQAKDLFFGYEF